MSFGSPGVGTSPHLSGVMFVNRTGLDAVHVPFRGAAQTIPAMLAGDVDFAIDNLASYVPAIAVRKNAGAGGHFGPTLADNDRRSDNGGSGHEGFRGDIMGCLRCAGRHAASDRRQVVRCHEARLPKTTKSRSDFWWAARACSPARRKRRSHLPPRKGRCGRALWRLSGAKID